MMNKVAFVVSLFLLTSCSSQVYDSKTQEEACGGVCRRQGLLVQEYRGGNCQCINATSYKETSTKVKGEGQY